MRLQGEVFENSGRQSIEELQSEVSRPKAGVIQQHAIARPARAERNTLRLLPRTLECVGKFDRMLWYIPRYFARSHCGAVTLIKSQKAK